MSATHCFVGLVISSCLSICLSVYLSISPCIYLLMSCMTAAHARRSSASPICNTYRPWGPRPKPETQYFVRAPVNICGKRTWIFCKDMQWGQNIIPKKNPTSMLNTGLLSVVLTAAHKGPRVWVLRRDIQSPAPPEGDAGQQSAQGSRKPEALDVNDLIVEDFGCREHWLLFRIIIKWALYPVSQRDSKSFTGG